MPKKRLEIEQKRPLDATPERALAMYEAGVKQTEIAKLWNIHPSRVSHLIAKARKEIYLVDASGTEQIVESGNDETAG